MTPTQSAKIIPFAPSRFAPPDKPIPRVRSDRAWREFEQSAVPEPWVKVLGGGLCWVGFGVAGFFIADLLARI